MGQDLANRAKWLKEAFANASQVYSAQDGNVINWTSFAAFSGTPGIAFSNVKAGDRIFVHAQLAVSRNAGTDVNVQLRWINTTGPVVLPGDVAYQFLGSTSTQPHTVFKLDLFSAVSDAASVTLRPEVRVVGTSPAGICTGDLVLHALHLRLGQT